MSDQTKLIILKAIHTVIWLFFNVVIFYMLYAVVVNRLDYRLWIGYGLVGAEILTLACCNFFCPLTIIARRYSNSTKANFDIYLPEWLARYNKLIYGTIVGVILILTIYRLLTGNTLEK